MTLSGLKRPLPHRTWALLLLAFVLVVAALVPAALVGAQESTAPERDLGAHYAPIARRIITETLR